ncbi:MAG: PA domain-containing protein, partial [Gammaproteobacteria bacterium]
MGAHVPILGMALLLACGPLHAQAPTPIRGFDASGSSAQRSLEQRLQSLASAESIRDFHRELTRAPHPATSARTREIAEYIADTWRAQGLDDVRVHRYVPTLREDPVAEDPDSAHPEISGAWASFSASGDVTAPVVYANSGNPADYAVLRANGIDPRGKIVVVRYSNPYSYRGFKALTAEREGAAAIIIYSDPQEDGFAKGTVYPEGP